MQISNKPRNLTVPFASGGAFNPIPTDSQIATSPNKASYADGFPPATRTPRAAGGIPPDGLDMNGILHDLSNAVMYQQAFGIMPWDSDFANATGYPKNAIISYNGVLYQSKNDDNKAAPTNTTAWKISTGGAYGSTMQISSDTTLTATSANIAYQFTGGYTAILPALSTLNNGSVFTFYNNTSGKAVVACSGSDSFGNGVNSVVVGQGDCLIITASSSIWLANGGSAWLKNSSLFASSLNPKGWQMLPDGSIKQWGYSFNVGTGKRTETINFPIAFPNAVLKTTVTCNDLTCTPLGGKAIELKSIQIFIPQAYLNDSGAIATTQNLGYYWEAIGF